MKNGNVSFRRIHGRIVPIKVGDIRKKEAAKGAAITASGIGVAAGAGALYRATVKQSVRLSSRAMSSLFKLDNPLKKQTLFNASARAKGGAKVHKLTTQMFKTSTRLGHIAPALRLGGLAAGSALVGVGVAKLFSAGRQRKPSKGEQAAIGSTAALGAFLTGSYGAAGARTAFKGVYVKAYPYIRAIKSKYRL